MCLTTTGERLVKKVKIFTLSLKCPNFIHLSRSQILVSASELQYSICASLGVWCSLPPLMACRFLRTEITRYAHVNMQMKVPILLPGKGSNSWRAVSCLCSELSLGHCDRCRGDQAFILIWPHFSHSLDPTSAGSSFYCP